jgi:hypothetical protein
VAVAVKMDLADLVDQGVAVVIKVEPVDRVQPGRVIVDMGLVIIVQAWAVVVLEQHPIAEMVA